MTDARHAIRPDLHSAAIVLADAFANDPWFNWVYPSASLWPHCPQQWFGLVLDRTFERGHTYIAESGTTTWIPPDGNFPDDSDLALAVSLLTSQIGERAGVTLGLIGQAGAYFPHRPRFHCAYVGVGRSAQGRGTGAALMSRVLQVCDRDQFPASLTSTNDANLAWYRSLGFNEVGSVAVPGTEFSLRPMWREPAGNA
ncbi:MAG: GNAT family N-acetyltransferase [Actinobacteria bacterium]|nr:GNAT family N-acetyltransferase [Actinomycetota bacterium]